MILRRRSGPRSVSGCVPLPYQSVARLPEASVCNPPPPHTHTHPPATTPELLSLFTLTLERTVVCEREESGYAVGRCEGRPLNCHTGGCDLNEKTKATLKCIVALGQSSAMVMQFFAWQHQPSRNRAKSSYDGVCGCPCGGESKQLAVLLPVNHCGYIRAKCGGVIERKRERGGDTQRDIDRWTDRQRQTDRNRVRKRSYTQSSHPMKCIILFEKTTTIVSVRSHVQNVQLRNACTECIYGCLLTANNVGVFLVLFVVVV